MLARPEGRRSRWPPVIAAAALAVYVLGTLAYIDRFPSLSQDEPWIASSGYKLATAGTLGTDLFDGYHGMERHHLVHMPLYPIVEAAIFRVFGLGIVQMRLLSIVCGLGLLLIVYAVGREIGGERMGAVAMALLVAQRLTAGTDVRPIGILLLDSARINRYDIAVPVFGLAALWVILRDGDRRYRISCLMAGVLAGLSGLSHLYGVFWLPALAAVLVARGGLHRSTLRAAALLAAGFALTWLPWLIWVGANWTDYVAQMRTVAARFDLFTPSFYIANAVSNEGPVSMPWLLHTLRDLPWNRMGAWIAMIGLPLAAVLLFRRGRRLTEGEQALLIVSTVQLLLFTFLLQVKSVNYAIAIWPLGALTLAWLGVTLWDSGNPLLRGTLVLVGVAIVFEGGVRIAVASREARTTSSYEAFEQQIAACIPPGSLVLGFQHYWPGLREFRFRSWLLPLNMTNPAFEHAPVPLDVALDRVNPDVILMDRYAQQLFEQAANPAHPYHYLATGFDAYKARRALLPRCTVRDPTYGSMEIYQVVKAIAQR